MIRIREIVTSLSFGLILRYSLLAEGVVVMIVRVACS